MFCEECGAKNDSSSKFCESCGAKLDFEEKATEKKSKAKAESKKTTAKKAEPEMVVAEEPKTKKGITKKTKTTGILIVLAAIILIGGYIYLSKTTGAESVATSAFKQLSKNQTISDKYLKESLDSDDYFVTLEDMMKDTIKRNDIALDYSSYEVESNDDEVMITYHDKKKKDKYKILFSVDKDGKTFGIFDKYIITKIEIKNETEDEKYTLYDPKKVSNATITAIKGTTVTIDGKKVDKKYRSKKESDDDTDVYKIEGITEGTHTFAFLIDKLKFESERSIYSKNNDINLTYSISASNLNKNTTEEYEKAFKKYINTYYEYIIKGKTIGEFQDEYETTSSIESKYNSSKSSQDVYKLTSLEFNSVKIDGTTYSRIDNRLSITYSVKYTYERDGEKKDGTARITASYEMNNIKVPVTLGYLPM